MERGAVLLLVLTVLYLVLSRSPAGPAVPHASGVRQDRPFSSDCCLIPANRGLYGGR